MANVYRTGSPVAHKGMALDPTGYVNREVNKGKLAQKPLTRRSGMAKLSLRRAASRRASIKRKAPRGVGG